MCGKYVDAGLNVFHVYLWGRIHLISFVFAVFVFLYGVLVQRGALVFRVRNSVAVLAFSHLVYEAVFTVFSRQVGYMMGADTGVMMKLYLACTFFCLSCLGYFNRKDAFLRLSGRNVAGSCLLFGVMGVSLLVMYGSGWFLGLQSFMDGTGDPHNLLWAISKAAGLGFMLPLYHIS